MEPRPAATTVLVRGSEAGPELLFVRRPPTMRAFAGFHAFPGGVLDAADHSDDALSVSTLSAEGAEAQMGEASGGLPAIAFFVCALREVFEEIGILYAEDSGAPASVPKIELLRAREALLADRATLAEIVRGLGLRLATHRLRFLTRWIAPLALPVRFDARFFVIEAAGDPDPHQGEVESFEWKTASQMLALAEAGAVMLAPPTVATLGSLVRYTSAKALVLGEAAPLASPSVERHSPLVQRIVAPNASIMTGPGTNTYLVGNDGLVVIDPGSMERSHLEAIAGAGRVTAIVVTHGHADHYSGAMELAQSTGAELAAPEPFMRGVATDAFKRRLKDGDVVETSGAGLQVLATPGHASDHICLWLPKERALFSGDLVLGEGTTVISSPDGDLAAYMRSLDRVASLNPERLYPGHFPPRDDAAGWIAYYISHRVEREAQIVAVLTEGPASIPAIVAKVYASYPVALHPIAERSVLAHLLKLRGEARTSEHEGVWRLTPSR